MEVKGATGQWEMMAAMSPRCHAAGSVSGDETWVESRGTESGERQVEEGVAGWWAVSLGFEEVRWCCKAVGRIGRAGVSTHHSRADLPYRASNPPSLNACCSAHAAHQGAAIL